MPDQNPLLQYAREESEKLHKDMREYFPENISRPTLYALKKRVEALIVGGMEKMGQAAQELQEAPGDPFGRHFSSRIDTLIKGLQEGR